MRFSRCLLAFVFVFAATSCIRSPFAILNHDPGSQKTSPEISKLASQEASPSLESDSTGVPVEEEGLARAVIPADREVSPSQEAEETEKESTDLAPAAEPYTDQKRIDDALDIYEEALAYRNQGEPDRALEALDQSYQTICGIQAEEDPEIAQQKEDLRLLISKRILEIYAARSQLQMNLSREIPLPMNEYISREIKIFQTTDRQFFIDSYRRSGKFRPYIVEQMKKAGLPEDLSWLPLIESGFKTKALSKARALGLWQFIASTGYRFDLRRDRWVDERMSLERSTRAAITYLKVLHDLFGDWTTVLAGYNCGEGNVLRVIRDQHLNYLDNFWDLYSRLPQETARYVPRFLAALHIIKDPEKYGFSELELAEPLDYEKVEINKQIRLRDIAGALDLSLETLAELNPSLRYKATPNYPYSLKVPADTAPVLLSKLEEIPEWQPPRRAYVVHRVRFGETLSEIAMRYRVPLRQIVRANHLRSASRIRAGQRLRIPLRGHFYASRELEPGEIIQYRVKRGDSLWLIARRYNTSVAKLKALNGMTSNLLHSGQIIRVASDDSP